MFDSATVCFTEIDGFKIIARSCTPLQLFDLLNTIYKTFDARIENNDVYKVETINDSYMVASGLPERNGDKHAAEIANLCLELLYITPGILIFSLRLGSWGTSSPGVRNISSRQRLAISAACLSPLRSGSPEATM